MPTNIRAVIFDLGRVLVRIDTTGEKFRRLMHAAGIPPEHAFSRYWDAPEVRQHMIGEIDSPRFYRLARERFGLDWRYEEFADAWSDLFHPDPAMKALFERLAGRYDMGLLSDTDPLHWARIRTLMPWLETVEKPTLSHEIGHLKPHPAMFAAAAANSGHEAAECLFVDDLVANVEGAREFGMRALQFEGAEKLERELNGLGIL